MTSLRTRFRRAFHAAYPERRLKSIVGRSAEIETHTTVSERVLLYEEAAASYHLARYLEIGCYLGASSVVLAEVLKRKATDGRGQLICVDSWQNLAMSEGRRDTFSEFVRNTSPWSKFIKPVRGNSREVTLPDEGQFDLIFIDADHTYEGCRADIDRFAPLVRDGGRLVLHDHQHYSGVTRVVGELLATGYWRIARSQGNIVSILHDGGHLNRHQAVSSFDER